MNYAKDIDLGNQVRQHLINNGVETPFFEKNINTNKVKTLFSAIMEELGIDLLDDSMAETPHRLAKMYSHAELFSGLDYANFPKATVVENKMGYRDMLIERNIKISSLCEHHWAPISGFAHIAYIPKDKVIGLSKLNRVADFFSRRPQIQERLTAQIMHTLQFLLDTQDVAVTIVADHYCVKMRGIMDANSDTVSSAIGGEFKKPEVRAEFLKLALAK